jgi:3',5'-cyclic-AMP phosphodiesterase
MSNFIETNLDADGIDRRGFLKCMAWAGTGVLYSFSGGVLRSESLSNILQPKTPKAYTAADFHFVQISDSHMGFSKDANKDVVGTLQAAIAKINALDTTPDLILHTGDISHLSKADEFDAVDQILMGAKAKDVFFVPGEHDVLTDSPFKARYGKNAKGDGWYSFDHKGVHFVGLVNVMNLKAGGLGFLGGDQIAWLADDLKPLSDSTPIVVFAHIPLWEVYPEWGWGTDDSAQALALLRRFGSVTVLNGHIHQTMQKVEGNITFHTATSTAFPQPKPGAAPSPGPMKVDPGILRSLLGITSVGYVEGNQSLAIVDSSLAETTATNVTIDNFSFLPQKLTVSAGTTVTWTNHDDMPHTVVSVDGVFKSKALDTGDTFQWTFPQKGSFAYFCSMHAHMKGSVESI